MAIAGPRYAYRELGKCPSGGRHHYEFRPSETVCNKCNHVALVPQFGPQEMLLTTKADIALFGGAKGGGKSYGLLLESVRHLGNNRFGAVVFRREGPEIYNIGGLWDTSEKIYPRYDRNVAAVKSRGEWVFANGARVKFNHLEYEKDLNKWDGQQVPLIGFDELTLFTEKQFWYMLTINRSTCGVRPYIRATCNPNADSWVAELVKWWIDQDTGFAIPARAGVVRYFVRADGQLVWGDSADQLRADHPQLIPKSFTFIPSKLDDNAALEAIDPDYRANLMAQPLVEQQRLLHGNWKIRPAAGLKFPRDKWVLKEAVPSGLRLCRFWDKAATEGGKGARTAGVLMGELATYQTLGLPRFWIVDVQAARWGDADLEAAIKATAHLDKARYGHVTIGMEREPGSGGKHSAYMTTNNLAGFSVFSKRPDSSKSERWHQLAAQQQIGNVAICQSDDWDWAGFVRELDALAGDEAMDKGKLKDCADAAAGAFEYLTTSMFNSQTELITSGDDPDRSPLTDDELDEMPEYFRELLSAYREHDDDRPRRE